MAGVPLSVCSPLYQKETILADLDKYDVVAVKHIVTGKCAEIRGTDIDNWKKHGYAVIDKVRREAPAVAEKVKAAVAPVVVTDTPKVALVADLSLDADTVAVLADLGIATVDELRSLDDETLLSYEPIGRGRLKAIRKALA